MEGARRLILERLGSVSLSTSAAVGSSSSTRQVFRKLVFLLMSSPGEKNGSIVFVSMRGFFQDNKQHWAIQLDADPFEVDIYYYQSFFLFPIIAAD